MTSKIVIPIFPLNILPINDELIPLHIFEPRYRQLLKDAEDKDVHFGILYAVSINEDRVGSLMKLETILKRYDTGESDIIVKCVGNFLLDKYFKYFKDRMYAGGEVLLLPDRHKTKLTRKLKNAYSDYQELINRSNRSYTGNISINDIANALNLDNKDRLKYVRLLKKNKIETFLYERLRYKSFLLQQEKHQSKFMLN